MLPSQAVRPSLVVASRPVGQRSDPASTSAARLASFSRSRRNGALRSDGDVASFPYRRRRQACRSARLVAAATAAPGAPAPTSGAWDAGRIVQTRGWEVRLSLRLGSYTECGHRPPCAPRPLPRKSLLSVRRSLCSIRGRWFWQRNCRRELSGGSAFLTALGLAHQPVCDALH